MQRATRTGIVEGTPTGYEPPYPLRSEANMTRYVRVTLLVLLFCLPKTVGGTVKLRT